MENIVLMAMSTLPDTKKDPQYIKATGDFRYPEVKNYESQLEPVTRLCLQNSPKNTTHLIILCTDETFKYKKAWGADSVSFFLNRIALTENGNHFLPDEEHDEYSVYHLDKDSNSRKVTAATIRINDNDQVINAIEIAVKMIKEIRSKDEISLWIAANGGLRESYSYISAIMSLLKYDGIRPSNILSTDTSKNEIIDYSASFRMFDFVTGLNEFKQFGSITTLKEYFKKNEDDPVMIAMGKIADATAQNNTNLFTEGLNELRDLYLNEEKEKTSALLTRNPEFRIFKDTIAEDYGPLLKNDQYHYIDIVERCVSKNQIQQALSFIESKMYLDYLSSNLLVFKEHPYRETVNFIKLFNNKGWDNRRHYVVDEEIKLSTSPTIASVYKQRDAIDQFIDNIAQGKPFQVPYPDKNKDLLFNEAGVKERKFTFQVPDKKNLSKVSKVFIYRIGTCISQNDSFAELAWLVCYASHEMTLRRSD